MKNGYLCSKWIGVDEGWKGGCGGTLFVTGAALDSGLESSFSSKPSPSVSFFILAKDIAFSSSLS